MDFGCSFDDDLFGDEKASRKKQLEPFAPKIRNKEVKIFNLFKLDANNNKSFFIDFLTFIFYEKA